MEYVPTISAAFRRQIQEYSAYFLETDLPVFPDSRIVIQVSEGACRCGTGWVVYLDLNMDFFLSLPTI